ncbi:MAG: lytic murein transglycosylase [Tabrizicola sp.]|uniref:lytic murein transglycosylase n=1 Tax=Tabrizicola sp. TaxID=2005166 RepID=UPI00273268BA|nr:lytic murein transglycosylase [Tabrizicola sp.]MDP3262658.1 lytic murein transglycosylase [Tabrizicola sp.]MDP3647818.1 lytic murein transglycosylase [Paracoccaceae bacterium]MDZ4069274.1 lytic murein transglycosylase [Tabrizicola sp.]
MIKAAVLTLALATPAAAAPCGGDFADFLAAMETEAIAAGTPPDAAAAFFASARQDPKVLKADRSQGVFRKTFLDFSQSLISRRRLATARAKSAELDAIFTRAEADYGTSRGILLAFWAFETDFGQVQGQFNTRNALLTLAHDCRRPDIFQPQVLAAAQLHALNEFDLDTTGAWAGEIGMVQMLPKDILERGVDGDGDGLVTLKTSPADAILSGARMLQHHGWRAGEPWLTEVALPDSFDWSLTGLQTENPTEAWAALGVTPREGSLPANLSASVLLPQGRNGPAFLVYPNYRVLFDWNKSFIYVTTAAYFATRIEGAPAYAAGDPDPALGPDEMIALQEKLSRLGHDVGQIDGILGAGTRAAVQREQLRLGLPADGWPNRSLLDAL